MGGREGRGALLLRSSQQCVKKLKKLTTTLFFAAGGLTVYLTYSQVLFLGLAWLSILFVVVVVVVFLFLFSEMLPPPPLLLLLPPPLPPPSPYAVAARQIPTYLGTFGYLTCRVADFTTLGTVP